MPPKQVDIEAALDQQRSRLEESITKLRKALSTWQNWSAEYEAFREELQTLPEDASREDMVGSVDRFSTVLWNRGADFRSVSWQPA